MPARLQLIDFIGGPLNAERIQVPSDAYHWRALWPREDPVCLEDREPEMTSYKECLYERRAFYDRNLNRFDLFLSSDCVALLATHQLWQIQAIANQRQNSKSEAINDFFRGMPLYTPQELRNTHMCPAVRPKSNPVKSMQDSSDTNAEAALRAILEKAKRHL